MSSSPDLVKELITAHLAAAKEYRQMAKEFFAKADQIEARSFELVFKLEEMKRDDKMREEAMMAEVMKETREKATAK